MKLKDVLNLPANAAGRVGNAAKQTARDYRIVSGNIRVEELRAYECYRKKKIHSEDGVSAAISTPIQFVSRLFNRNYWQIPDLTDI